MKLNNKCCPIGKNSQVIVNIYFLIYSKYNLEMRGSAGFSGGRGMKLDDVALGQS